MKRPENLSADDLWKLLGEFANDVAMAEGNLFTDNAYVYQAANQYYFEQERLKNENNSN
jgi:hypothetical protein